MSDWTSGFQAFNQGMGMLADANERKRRQAVEDERLTLEKNRALSESETAALTRKMLQNRLDRLNNPPKVPEGFQVEGYDTEGFPKVGRIPQEPKLITLPDGSQVYYRPDTGEFKPKDKDYTEMFLGGGMKTAQPQPSQTTGEWRPPMLPPVKMDKPVSAPAFGAPAGGASLGRPVVTGLSGGRPTMEFRFDPTAPIPRTTKGPDGKEYLFYETTNEKGQKQFSTPQPAANKMSADTEEKLTLALTAMDALPQMAADIQKFGDEGGPTASKMLAPWQWAFGPSEARRTLDQSAARTLTPIAKGILGETGALSEGEQQRYGTLIPKYEDTQEARKQKFNTLREQVAQAAKNRITLMKQGGQDTSGIEAEFTKKLRVIDDAYLGIPNVDTQEEAEAKIKDGTIRLNPSGQIRIGGQLTKYTP